MISARRIVAGYGKNVVLRDLSLDVRAGECVALTGAADSGKTTLLRVLAGFIEPLSGTIHLQGDDRPTDAMRLRREVSYASDELPGSSGLRIDEYFRFVTAMRGIRATREALVTNTQRLGVDTAMPVDALRREHRAVVAIAAALLTTPSVLLVDEVIDAVAAEHRPDVLSWLADTRALGAAVVVVTNRPGDNGPCDRELVVTSDLQSPVLMGAVR
jgi:ABC-type multidrug transport system ATPase subunit